MNLIRNHLNKIKHSGQVDMIRTALQDGKIPVVEVDDGKLFYVTEIDDNWSQIRGCLDHQFKDSVLESPTRFPIDNVLRVREVVEKRRIGWVEDLVKELTATLMRDDRVCAFQSSLGKRYYLLRDARYHCFGFSAFTEETGYIAPFTWDLLGYYDGVWFPDNQASTSENVRDKSHPSPIAVKEQLLTAIEDIKKRLQDLEHLAAKL